MELKSGYKQTEAGVIPEDWEVKALKEISPRQSVGLVINPSTYFDSKESIPMLVGSSVTENRIDAEAANRISAASNFKLAASRLTQGDLVTVRVGDPGVTAVVPPELDQCNCASMMIVRQDRSFNSHWLCSTMNSRHGRQQVENVQYGTAQKQFNIKDAVNFIYAVPPLQEQNQIATVLSEVELLLMNLEQVITKKHNIKQAAMQELLTGKRRLPGFEGEWEEVSLGSVAMMNSGGTPPTGRNDFYGGGIPWVSISDMTSGGRFISETERTLSDLGLLNCAAKRFPAGTILYAMYASLGECSVATCEVTTSQAILGIRPSPSLIREYLYYYLCSIHGMVKQLGQQGTQSNLNKKIVQGFTIKLPKQTEQIAIANILSDIDQDIDMLNIKAEKARAMKTGMMQQLLTGKIRLK
jgi:type I restriction enzyme S subunit